MRGRAESELNSVSVRPPEVKLQYLGWMPPLTIGPRQLFSDLRTFLTDSNYSEAAVCNRLGLKQATDYLSLRPDPNSPHAIKDQLDLLTRLFLIGETVPEDQLKKVPAPVRQAMSGLGLIAPFAGLPDAWYATTALYPAYGLYIASDRWTNPDLAPLRPAVDIVYPAITPNTGHFLEALPSDPCDSLLDLCSGSGIAALMGASRYARDVLATDITEASELCAEFNRLLNGIENLTVSRGDLFEPAGERTFDRIVANPPYMPSLKPAEIYAYGGELGEHTTRRVIEALPKYLRPGGRFYCITAGPDLEEETFETRLRKWLGDAGRELDLLVFERKLFEPSFIANQQAAKTRGGPEELEQWKKIFDKYHVENLVYASLVIQRKTAATRPVTVRRRKGPQFGSAEIEWLRIWETTAADKAILRKILDSRPLAARDLELRVIHRNQNGELAPQEFILETKYPFVVECPIRPWAAYLIPRCDGKTPARNLLAYLKENDLVGAAESEEGFADFLRVLISAGFLEIEGFRLPAH